MKRMLIVLLLTLAMLALVFAPAMAYFEWPGPPPQTHAVPTWDPAADGIPLVFCDRACLEEFLRWSGQKP